ncbi:transmembrane protein 44 isoform X2 [Brienomyrus brachyistius]|uniref:transmembrane protein 44 isoform X2 n=1 Tax=Brienomyrus brachyistius TaxID=42636 RepID=UPI0020B2A57A|nr:transmembrane protein 44 isoform X2 [Brienomyrus brachyistius]
MGPLKQSIEIPNTTTRYFLGWTSWLDPEFTTCFFEPLFCVPAVLCCLSAILLAIAYFLLICKDCVTKRSSSAATAACALYCLLGNLSGAVGALLSNQLLMQMAMGVFMTGLDIVRFMFFYIPVCLCKHSKSARRIKVVVRKRRQSFLLVSFPMVLGAWLYLWPRVTCGPLAEAQPQRRLLGISPQDNGEILGYTLGLLSCIIGWTSRLPAVTEAHQGMTGSTIEIGSGVLCVLAGVLYASAVLLYDTHLEPVVKAMPWILTAAGCAAFDAIIVALSCYRRWTGWKSLSQYPKLNSAETQALLGNSTPRRPRTTASASLRGLSHTPLQDLSSNRTPNKPEVGQYIDVTVPPTRKICLKEVKISREGQCGSQTLKRIRVVRVDSPRSSDGSSDTSSVSSDLEWDFEDANAQWGKIQKEQESCEAFSLCKWTMLSKAKPDADPKQPCEGKSPSTQQDH